MKNNATAKPIHKGEVTHHQDQLIVSVNFNIKKIKNNTLEIPIPPEEALLLFAIFTPFILHKG